MNLDNTRNALSRALRALNAAGGEYDRAHAAARAALTAAIEAVSGQPELPEPPPAPPTRPPQPTEPPPAPTTPPRPEPPAPRPPPPTTHGSAEWDLVVDGKRIRGSARTDTGEIQTQAGPFWLTVIWDSWHPSMPPTPTLFLKRSQGGRPTAQLSEGRTGTQPAWYDSLRVVVDGTLMLDETKPGLILPRGAIARSRVTVADWGLLPETEAVPAKVRADTVAQFFGKDRGIGPYRFSRSDTDDQAPSGNRITPHQSGTRGWLGSFSDGRLALWNDTLDAAQRGLWLAEDDGSPWMPGPHGVRYWWQASSTEYALSPWRWEYTPAWKARVPWAEALTQEGITALDHGSRFYGAPFALARWSRAAAHVARECVLEVMRAYSMDRGVPATSPTTHDDDGYTPLWQALELPGRPNLERRDGHAMRVMAEASAAGLLTDWEAATYLPAFVALAEKADDGRGVIDHTTQLHGDTTSSGLQPPVAMFFHSALICDALRFIADECESRSMEDVAIRARAVAERIADWWTKTPPYYARTGGAYKNALEAPHAGSIGHDYAMFIWPGTFGPYKSFADLVAHQWEHGEDRVGCVPRAWRKW